MNTIQKIKIIKNKRAKQELPGFKFANANHQQNNLSFAGVSEMIPIVQLCFPSDQDLFPGFALACGYPNTGVDWFLIDDCFSNVYFVFIILFHVVN